MNRFNQFTTARKRLAFVSLVGVIVGGIAVYYGAAWYSLIVAYDVAALLYITLVLTSILPMNAIRTKQHALWENPGRATADMLLLVASLMSLLAVGILIFRAGSETGNSKIIDTSLGLLSVIISWGIVHTVFLLKYARLYYGHPEGGIDFNQSDGPSYADFAYIAFTIGMTFQISDTTLRTRAMRAVILKHALLSYIFGTVIVASTINVIVSLST